MIYDTYKKQLVEFLKFKSISTDQNFQPEIQKSVNWLKTLFEENRFNVQILEGKTCNPVISANYETDPAFETILVYGHYDIQPANQEDGWYAEPFSLLEKDGRIYGRGIVDNKGQILIHISTVLELIKQNNLKYNVKFLIEGNEETSNEDLPEIIKDNKDLLACNYIIVSDGEILGQNPVLEYSLRGGFSCKLEIKTANNNLHSGIFGGAVPNAAYELSKFVSKLYDQENRVNVQGFYDNVDEINDKQMNDNRELTKLSQNMIENTGVKTLLTEPDFDFFTQIGCRPTIQITGFKSGYIGEGFSNIVPSSAEARLNFRIVTSQKALDVIKIFEVYVKNNTPKYVEYYIEFAHVHNPIKINVESQMADNVAKLLERAFGTKVYKKPVGGAIPIVTDFKNVLGKDTLLVSLGNDDCNMHGINENFDITLLEKGLKFSRMFFSKS